MASSFHSVNPLKKIKQDLLGREPWVKNLAGLITNYSGGDSLTIGIHGKWGSGKSTLINFVTEELAKPENCKGLVVGRFNPWNFSQQDRLYSTFFSTVATLLKKTDKATRVEEASDLLDTLAVLTAPGSLVPARSSLVPESIRKLSGISKGYANVIGDVEHVKDSISKTLGRSESRLVIVIDDIDRLTIAEIRQVFQLVKSMADFQNVVYLLAFDHDTVAKALDGVTDNRGYEYLEKITNVVLTAPPLTESQVRKLVYNVIKAYADRQREYRWNSERMRSVIDVANGSFTTIRQVYRFNNALTATEQMAATDIDFADHIALTLLQTFEPRLHEFIGTQPALFVDEFRSQFGEYAKQDDADKATIEKQLDKLNGMRREDAHKLLAAVFPKMSRLYSHGSKDPGRAAWRKQARACADYRALSRYFVFQVDDGDLSTAERDVLWQSTETVEGFEAYLRSRKSNEKLFSALEYLKDAEAGTLADKRVRVMVTALVDVGDEFRQLQGLDELFRGPFLEVIRALKTMLDSRTQEMRFEMALEALRRPPRSLEMACEIAYVFTKQNFGMFTPGHRSQLIQACSDLLKAAWVDGRLVKHRSFPGLFADWIGEDGEPNVEIVATIRETLAFDDVRFLEVVGRYENVQDERDEPQRFLTKYLLKVYSMEELRDRLKAIGEKSDFRAEHERLNELVEGVEQEIKRRRPSTHPKWDVVGTLPQPEIQVPPDLEIVGRG